MSLGSVFALLEAVCLHLRVHIIDGDCVVLCRKLWLRPLPRCITVLLCRLSWTSCAGQVSLGSVLAFVEAARQHLRVYVMGVHYVVLFSKVAAMWSAALHCSAAEQAMRHTSVFGVCFHTSGRRAPIFVRLCRLCRIIALAPAAWGSSWGSNPHR